MKPLSTRTKTWLYQHVVYGGLRPLAKPFYDGLLAVELSWHRMVDAFHAKDRSDMSQLTAIIKTFERPSSCRRLVRSIRRRYPGLKILVVDDSQAPQAMPGAEKLNLPYDTGISEGRNQALDHINTPYFLLLDDDFVFSHRQCLGEYLALMDKHPEIDILGGRYLDLPLNIVHEFQNSPLHHTSEQPIYPLGTEFSGLPVADKVQNYFVGRTASVRQVKWSSHLKVFEHTDFFTRARGRLTTVYHPGMLILHAKTPFDIAYQKMRYRWQG